jgi:hypothetical protein
VLGAGAGAGFGAAFFAGFGAAFFAGFFAPPFFAATTFFFFFAGAAFLAFFVFLVFDFAFFAFFAMIASRSLRHKCRYGSQRYCHIASATISPVVLETPFPASASGAGPPVAQSTNSTVWTTGITVPAAI